MYECRCPHDGRKLAEIARLPFSLMKVVGRCPCGRPKRAQIVSDRQTNQILALISCECGRVTVNLVGYLVAIQCPKCKSVVRF